MTDQQMKTESREMDGWMDVEEQMGRGGASPETVRIKSQARE